MRERDLQVLEFDKVLALLADCTLSSAGREACLALRPQTEPEKVETESERTWQFFRLSQEFPTFPHRQFPDIHLALQQAAPEGAALEGRVLLAILDVAVLSRTLLKFFLRVDQVYTQLADFSARLLIFPTLEETLRRCLTDNGALTDDASPELHALRRRLRALGQELEQRLERMLRAPEMHEFVADHYITIRNNRFVLPVRTSRQTRVPGVVQDRSSSGETVFIEPLVAVELNNRLLLTKKEEEAEENRVLLWLTSLVRGETQQLAQVFTALTDIDVLYAKALLARKYGGTKPRFDGNAVQLRAARHPLLVASGKPVTSIDLLIPEGKSGLIISGPNTGGKTVALKTLGLLCLMAQSGLFIPVEENNCLPIFQGIFADIGDPQSLEQSLSTFAAHMQNLAEVLRDLSPPALVLFDEPGGGTDPIEGGALACGVLTYLQTRGAMVAAVTHLTPVKLFALSEGSYQVAAVEFDVDTFTPHYRLHYDTIGQSLGLAMARRLGVPEAACAAAEAALSHEARHLTGAITRLEETRAALEAERAVAAAEREQAVAFRQRQQELVAKQERQQRILQDKLTEAQALIRQLRQDRPELASRVHVCLGSTSVEACDAGETLTPSGHQQARISTAKPETVRPALPEPCSLLKVGDEVETDNGQVRGELVAVRGHRARIRHGGVTFDVAIAQIRKIG